MNPTLAGQQSNHTSVSHHGIETECSSMIPSHFLVRILEGGFLFVAGPRAGKITPFGSSIRLALATEALVLIVRLLSAAFHCDGTLCYSRSSLVGQLQVVPSQYCDPGEMNMGKTGWHRDFGPNCVAAMAICHEVFFAAIFGKATSCASHITPVSPNPCHASWHPGMTLRLLRSASTRQAPRLCHRHTLHHEICLSQAS